MSEREGVKTGKKEELMPCCKTVATRGGGKESSRGMESDLTMPDKKGQDRKVRERGNALLNQGT